MATKIITLATSKGGAGKSTLVRNLSAYWLNIGFRVAVVDADPQGSIINRYNPKGILEKLYVIADPEETVGTTVEELRNNYKINISGYDKFQPEWSEKPNKHFDIVTCNYVLNVIEDPLERFELIEELKTMGDQIYITVRSDIKSIKDNWIPYNDGYLTGRKNNCTFQKIYTIDMIKDEFGDVEIIMANSTGIMFKIK